MNTEQLELLANTNRRRIIDMVYEAGVGHAKLCMIGVEDCFTESGKSKQVKEKYGLSGENILKKITETLKD